MIAANEQLLSLLPYPALIVGENGMVRFGNESARKLLRLSEAELLQRSWAGLDAHLTLLAWRKKWQALRNKTTARYRTDLSAQGQYLLPVDVHLTSLDDNSALLLLGERSTKQEYKAIIDAIGRQQAAYWVYNIISNHWSYSSAFCERFGLTAEKIENVGLVQVFEDHIDTIQRNKIKALLDAAITEGKAFDQELVLQPSLERIQLKVEVFSNELHPTFVVGTLSTAAHEAISDLQATIAQFSIDHARDMILCLDDHETIIYASPSLGQRLGYTSEELQQQSARKLLRADASQDLKKIREDLSETTSARGEVQLLGTAGKLLLASYRSNLIRYNEQEVLHLNLRDIGERRRQEKLLEFTQYSTDNAPDLIFWTRPDGSFLYANKLAHQLLEFEENELEDAPVTAIAPYFDDAVREEFWRVLREEGRFNREYPLYTKSGKEIIISASVNHLKIGEQEIACSFCRDITALQKDQLRQRLMAFTLDSSTDMVLWVERDGHIRYFNDSFLQRSGYNEEQIRDATSTDFFPYATPERRAKLWEILRHEGQHEMETYLLTASGEQLPVKAHFNYIQHEGEELNSVFFRDLSKKKEQDLRIKLSSAALASASEAIAWLDASGTVRYLNPSALAYLGGHAEDWLGKEVSTVFPQLALDQIQPGASLEYHMPAANGGTVYLELTFAEVQENEEYYLTIVGRNFTERYQRRKELEQAYERIEELSSRLQQENVLLREEVDQDRNISNIITVSAKYKRVLKQAGQVAKTDTTVLILGETGTGKELLARAIHSLSQRSDYPLVKINCAALPPNLIESELFGHEKGAFTGAREQKKGRFELAHQGTLFLDEVGELPINLQAKLLRVLQEGEFERLGSTETLKVDVRLVAATNRSLVDMVKNGSFRADLYYRLNVFPIVNFPLRERPADIPVLAKHFAKKYAQEQGKKIRKINSADLEKLKKYRFPGNVRELENIIERAVVFCQGDTLNIDLDRSNAIDINDKIFLTFDEMQRDYIIQALKKTGGRITGPSGAGRLLGLNDRTLMSKIRKFKIEKREYIV